MDVRYGSQFGTIQHTFTGTADTDVITSPSSGVIFNQLVRAAGTPDGGITVSAGSSGTLEVDAGPDDQIITVTASTSISGSVQLTDTSANVDGISSYGAGISNLTLRTNNNIASTQPVLGGTPASTDGTLVNVPSLVAATTLRIYTGASTYDLIRLGGTETVQNAQISTGAGHNAVMLYTDGDDSTTATIDFGAGSGSGNGLGLGNELDLFGGATAVLNQIGSTSHTVVVDTVNVNGGGTLDVAHASTIGDIEVDSLGTVVVDAASTIITLNNNGTTHVQAPSTISTLTGDGTTEFTGTANPSTVSTVNAASGILTVDSGATIHITSDSTIGTLNVLGMVDLNGSVVGTPLAVTALTIDSTGLLDIGKSFL